MFFRRTHFVVIACGMLGRTLGKDPNHQSFIIACKTNVLTFLVAELGLNLFWLISALVLALKPHSNLSLFDTVSWGQDEQPH